MYVLYTRNETMGRRVRQFTQPFSAIESARIAAVAGSYAAVWFKGHGMHRHILVKTFSPRAPG